MTRRLFKLVNCLERREPINVGLVVEFSDVLLWRFRATDDATPGWCARPDIYAGWIANWERSLACWPAVDWPLAPSGTTATHYLDDAVWRDRVDECRDDYFERIYRELVLPHGAAPQTWTPPGSPVVIRSRLSSLAA